jgi:hypothetical protein
MTRRPRAAILIAASLVATMIGFPINAARAAGCEPTKPLSNATLTTSALPGGGEIRKYQFAPGQANSSNYSGRLAVAKISLNFANVTPTHSQFGSVLSHENLAASVNALVHINSDFFDFNTLMPYSAVGHNSALDYSPQGSSRVVGVRLVTASAKTGIRALAYATSGTKKVSIYGLNLSVVPNNSAVAFSSAFSENSVPNSDYSVLVVGGKVKALFPSGTTIRPSAGYLFSAKGSAVAALRKFKVGSKVSYKPAVGKIEQLTLDRVVPDGHVTTAAGRILASITGVNTFKASYQSGVVLYTDAYSGNPPVGGATVVVDGSNLVTRVTSWGLTTYVPNGYKVLQFYGSSATQISSFSVGLRLAISPAFKSTSGNKYTAVFGSGRNIIKNGVVDASCVGSVDTIRPRTAIGWDDSGHVYLATTTMGRDWPDGGAGGYRVGGSTVHQLADWLKSLGATNAVALDGGGSTTMFALQGGGYHRVDLPDGVWTRWIPVGIALTSR